MGTAKIKRFYDKVSVVPRDARYAVVLDERPIRTPGGRTLELPTEPLANAVAGEWAAVAGEAGPMPLTRLAEAAIDHVAWNRAPVVEELVGYAKTDLICYGAGAPAGLAELQKQAWDPLHRWAATELNAPLRRAVGLISVEQPEASLAALAKRIAAHDDFRLAALLHATRASGSLVIALALSLGQATASSAWHASRIDETWQRQTWGDDEDDLERTRAMYTEFESAARFMTLLGAMCD